MYLVILELHGHGDALSMGVDGDSKKHLRTAIALP